MNVPLTAEYYDGTDYQVNQDDACTAIADTSFSLSNAYQTGVTGTIQVCAAGGTTSLTVTNNPFAAGEGMLALTAPGAD